MLPPERRLPNVRTLIARQQFFTVHAPRQVGKTTSFLALADSLTQSGEYAALLTSFEMGQTFTPDLEGAVDSLLSALASRASVWPEAWRPPTIDRSQPARVRLYDYLRRWAQKCPRPLVLFFDEIDALIDETLLSVLRQLRTGYLERPDHFPWSIALIGLRDVRDYRIQTRGASETLGTASPFNIKVESIRLRDFTAAEVSELYGQFGDESFTEQALDRAFALTRGQPWLVNALAAELVERVAPGQDVYGADAVDAAKERLILRQDTHLGSLIERLREPRVRRVIEPILAGVDLGESASLEDHRYASDLGLVAPGESSNLEIANPIYREIIPRALASVAQTEMPLDRRPFVAPDGSLRFSALLDGFGRFWSEHAEAYLSRQPYSEAAAQLIFMAYLQRVVNGGGLVDREYGVGSGRIDLHLRWPRRDGGLDRYALELKVWRAGSADPTDRGLDQLCDYLERLGLPSGVLVIFDARSSSLSSPPREESPVTVEHRGRRIEIRRF
ncbi:MAG: AAA-like domain-containing protein [Acidobacteriota bacterium]